MSDGGEGLLDALGGDVASARRCTGPLGARRRRVADADPARRPTAVIEMSHAAGVPSAAPRGDDPVRAGTAGVGEPARPPATRCCRRRGRLRRSATTDGGQGAFDVRGLAGACARRRARRGVAT